MAEHSIKCAACGGDLTAETAEELAQKLRDHAKEHHGIDMTLEMARQKVQEANPV
jgi:predicted small metal-binding protein